jgi:serine phosphatase RsbU (regulator of sigma subunit)
MCSSPSNTEPLDDATAIEIFINRNLDRLVAACRAEMLKRPELEKFVKPLHIDHSEDWVRNAISLFGMCIRRCTGPAAEWHDEVGGLNFTSGLNMAEANAFLGILRNATLQLVWNAVDSGEFERGRQSELVQTILRAYDHALALQAEAYVRESKRHLHEVNRQLEFRKEMFDRDIALAELVQKKFIPNSFKTANFEAEVRYVPVTGIGGDHAGIFELSPGRVYVTVYDVTGHGIASALVAEIVNSQLRAMLRRQVDSSFQYAVEPVDIIRELNTLVHDEFQPLGMLISFFAALVDSPAGTITYSGAGHPPAILQCCSAHNIIELVSQNIMLGAVEDCVLNEGQDSVPLHESDRLIVYTDGIIESGDAKRKMLGVEGLEEIVKQHYDSSPKDLADEILAVARKLNEKNVTDDMSLILLDILGGHQPCSDKTIAP